MIDDPWPIPASSWAIGHWPSASRRRRKGRTKKKSGRHPSGGKAGAPPMNWPFPIALFVSFSSVLLCRPSAIGHRLFHSIILQSKDLRINIELLSKRGAAGTVGVVHERKQRGV